MRTTRSTMATPRLAECAVFLLWLSACGSEPEDVTGDDSSALNADAGSPLSIDGTSSTSPLGPEGAPLVSCVLVDLSAVGEEPSCAAGCWPFYAEAAWGCLPDGLNQGEPAFIGCVPDNIDQIGIADAWTGRSKFTSGVGVRVNAGLANAMEALGALGPGDEGHEAATQAMQECMETAGVSFPTD